MKNLILSFLTLVSLTSHAQPKPSLIQSRFVGYWAPEPESVKSIVISDRTSSIDAGEFMLHVHCNNAYRGDTLLLYVDDIDAHVGFPRKWIPAQNSLFAKCYIRNKTLYLRYTQKVHRDNAKEIDLPVKLYKFASPD